MAAVMPGKLLADVLAGAMRSDASGTVDGDPDSVPYTWPRTSAAPLTDDFGRLFPGNPGNASNILFTQCWNVTDQPAGMLHMSSTPPVLQI